VSGGAIKVLFVCSRNQWRSPTAEAIYKGFDGVQARSAGTSPQARVRINDAHLRWADIIFVMEKRHKQLLEQRFGRDLSGIKVISLDIPDDYQFMDEDLISTLKARLRQHIPVPA
jgi:predicted protein tyrosine phosphatase